MSHTTDAFSSSPGSRSDDLADCRRQVTELSAEVGVLRQALAIRQFNADSTYRIIFDSITDAVFIQTVEDGTIVDVNRRAVMVSGYGRDELLGESFMLLDSAASSSPLVPGNALWEAAQAGQELQFECSIITKNGQSIGVEGTLKRVDLAGRERMLIIFRDIAERKERERLQEVLIQTQAQMLADLSTPLIPISDRVVVMPLVGSIDVSRAQRVLETLLTGIVETRATTAILDITGVPLVDTQVADALLRAAQAVRLLGAQVVLTGIRAEIAQTLVGLGADLRGITTYATLQTAIAHALASTRSSS